MRRPMEQDWSGLASRRRLVPLALGGLAGCATAMPSRSAQRFAADDCADSRHLVVRNPLGQDLDVYNGRTFLGRAGPGVSEYDLSTQRIVGFYAYYADTRRAAYLPTAYQKSLVGIDVVCGPPRR